jgi:hypothetical protein
MHDTRRWILTVMPNSERCVLVYLFVDVDAVSGHAIVLAASMGTYRIFAAIAVSVSRLLHARIVRFCWLRVAADAHCGIWQC